LERNQAVAIVVAAILIGSIALVVLWNPAPQPDVRIGYLSKDLHQLALRVAIENGYFEREGIVVNLVEYANGAYEMDGFLAGEIDMGYLGAAPALVKRINQDILVTVLAAVNMEGSAIMASKSEYDAGHVTTITDLVGKEVLHPGPATVQNFLLRLALNQSGLSIANITTAQTLPALMADSLSANTPAFVVWEPFNALAQYEGKAVPLALSGEIWPRHPCCVVATDNIFMINHPDIVQKAYNNEPEDDDAEFQAAMERYAGKLGVSIDEVTEFLMDKYENNPPLDIDSDAGYSAMKKQHARWAAELDKAEAEQDKIPFIDGKEGDDGV